MNTHNQENTVTDNDTNLAQFVEEQVDTALTATETPEPQNLALAMLKGALAALTPEQMAQVLPEGYNKASQPATLEEIRTAIDALEMTDTDISAAFISEPLIVADYWIGEGEFTLCDLDDYDLETILEDTCDFELAKAIDNRADVASEWLSSGYIDTDEIIDQDDYLRDIDDSDLEDAIDDKQTMFEQWLDNGEIEISEDAVLAAEEHHSAVLRLVADGL